MRNDELKTKVEELEAMIQSGYDYAQAETQARELLVDDALVNEPELHARTLLALSESLRCRGMAQDALPYAEQALTLAELIHSKVLRAKALGNIGRVHQNLSDYSLALDYLDKALSLAEELGNKASVAAWLSNIGIVHLHLSDYSLALEYHRKALALHEELGNKKGVAIQLGNIGGVYWYLSDYALALEYMGKALSLYEELGNKAGVARHLGNIGLVYQNLSDYALALECYGKALAIDEELGNKAGVAIHLGNVGNVYQNLSDYTHALEYYDKSLALAEELGNRAVMATHFGNIGVVHGKFSDYANALEYLGKALSLDEELGNKASVARHLGNIGAVYRNLSDYANALEYLDKALSLDEELGNKAGVAEHLGNIGSVYAEQNFDGYDPVKAEEYLLKALSKFEDIGAKNYHYEAHKVLADFYERQGRKAEAYDHYKKYHELEKEVQSEESKKQAERLDYERKTAEREKRIAVERAESQARIEEQEKLLHNVLPPTIAERLLKKETFIADSYPSVSVLFMDLVGFTRIASIVPPKHLIYLLNSIFSAADNIMEQYGLEKIKTIGDAYMAVAGAPESQEDHAIRAASASIALLDRMNTLHISIPSELGDISWIESIGEIGVRIGIHSGEAIGGVIGDKKFSFDLWGDAVNTASRMESHGEAGKIHCSAEFMRAVETVHTPSLRFIPRGEMEIKGKGKMRTYFLEKA
jgi:class 3 adenylate cyclase